MELVTLFLSGIIILLCYLEYLFYYSPKAALFKKIHGPNKLPLVGNLFMFLLKPVPLFYMGRYLANKYKQVYSVQVCQNRVLNIYNPKDIEIILSSSKHIAKSHVYQFLHPWLKEGLLTSKGEKWHQRRKILTPAFHFNILRQFCKTFEEQGQSLIDDIKSQDKDVIDVIPVISQFTLNSICETAMGTQTKSNDNANFNHYKDAVYKMGHFIVERLTKIWLHFDGIFQLTKLYQQQTVVLDTLHDFTTSVIRQRRKDRESGQGVQIKHEEDIENDEYIKSSKKRLAMLDLLLVAEDEGRIDNKGIREEVDTFMFEGHDTTAMGISFALMILANYKNEQTKIVKELKEIFGDSNKDATIEDLNNMKYLEMCIKESLRLYPSVPFISRMLDEEVKFENYTTPAETICHIHIYDLHRDPSIYQSPDEFIPERFTLENSSKRHTFAYIPFSAGPRNCIGQKFAMLEIKSVISNLLRHFTLEPVTRPQDIIFSSDLVLRSRDPIYVKFVPTT